MRYIFTFVLLFYSVLYGYGQQSIVDVSCLCDKQTNVSDGEVKFSISSFQMFSHHWDIVVEVNNMSSKDIFLLDEPKRADGSKGLYISADKSDPTILILEVLFYDSPKYYLYRNLTGVKLRKLEPNNKVVKNYTIDLPLEQTIPPFGSKLHQKKILSKSEFKVIKVNYGFLPSNEGIINLIKINNSSKPFFDGYYGGKEHIESANYERSQLIKLQKTLSATINLESAK